MSVWTGRTAVVTGSARGIGDAIVRRLEAAGATVFGLDRTPSPACRHARQLDVTDRDALVEAVNEIREATPGCDALIHCAGICPVHAAQDADLASWRRTFEVNLFAAAELTRLLTPHLNASQGSVVFVASVSAWLPKPDQVEYGASKAAMLSLMRSLAAVMAPSGVRVNAVAPGVIDTEMTREIADARGVPPQPAVPLGRLGTAEEVASAVLFLAGPEASYVTGQVLAVDGGLTMR